MVATTARASSPARVERRTNGLRTSQPPEKRGRNGGGGQPGATAIRPRRRRELPERLFRGQLAPARGYHRVGPPMTNDSPAPDDLLDRARAGDPQALVGLFGRYRDRLKRMVRLRLDRRLQGRIDASDVLQEAYLDLARRAPEYFAGPPTLPFF